MNCVHWLLKSYSNLTIWFGGVRCRVCRVVHERMFHHLSPSSWRIPVANVAVSLFLLHCIWCWRCQFRQCHCLCRFFWITEVMNGTHVGYFYQYSDLRVVCTVCSGRVLILSFGLKARVWNMRHACRAVHKRLFHHRSPSSWGIPVANALFEFEFLLSYCIWCRNR